MTKPALKIVSPATVKRKVAPRRPRNADVRTREYLTEKEVEKLIEGCEGNRRPHRDATMILIAFRHGLRASEVCDLQWTQVDFAGATLAVTRAKHGTPSTHPLTGRELRALRRLHSRGRRPIAVPIRVRARLADDREQLPEAHQPSLRGYRAQNQSTPAHAEARLRLQARKRRPRYARPAGIPRASEHPAHGALHRAGTDPVQGMVERLKPGLHPTFSAMRPRPDLETTVQRATTSRGRFGNPVRFDDMGAPYTCLSEPAGKFSPDASSRDTGGSSTHVGDNRRKRDISPVAQEELPTCLERSSLCLVH